jgi:predicted nucleotide-binding protein (sugar kinase/HSP70/actin superfamily)
MALSTFHGSSVVLAPSPLLGFSLTCSETFSLALSISDPHLLMSTFKASLAYPIDLKTRYKVYHDWLQILNNKTQSK